MRRQAACILAFCLALACSNSGVGKQTAKADASSVFSTEVTQPDTGTVAPTDIMPEVGTLDVIPADTNPANCPGSGGCPCTEHANCESGLCIDDPATDTGKACAKKCTTTCPDTYTCAAVTGAGGDILTICVPKFAHLCDPCTTSKDCESLGLKDAACTNQGAAGSFCGTACTTDNDCPTDYTCANATTAEGGKFKQCQRKPDKASSSPFGTCPCSTAAIKKKLPTACYNESKDATGNVIGKCPGVRTCESAGLTACAAPTIQAETCNGKDDDCDGQTDESSCDDGKPCTDDTCDPASGCLHSAKSGADCDADGSVCTEGDTCLDGVCKPGAPKNCDDKNPCTADVCDAAKGCTQTVDDGNPCDADGDACSVGDVCMGGVCLAGKAILCDDQNPCTKDGCEAASGKCKFVTAQDGIACDDGTLCTQSDQCTGGECVGKPLVCDDKNPCTTETCDAKKACQRTNADGAGCDDDNPCTVGDSCAGGECKSGKPKTCAEGDACQTWKCDVASGKCTVKDKPTGDPCDDGSKCTTGDACTAGDCAGQAVLCDDSNPCTDDSCKAALGCAHTANTAPCDDGSACTVGDLCNGSACVAGKDKVCDDQNACTADTCDPATGKCESVAVAGACNDGNACTENDGCKDGLCVGTGANCDDGNSCTADSCDSKTACLHVNTQAPCNDGNACTDADTCKAGSCVGAAKPSGACDDQNPCTTDSCDPASGCGHAATADPCDDGNVCTTGDTCLAKQCVSGTNTCACAADADCAKLDDDNLCNGSLFCDNSDPKAAKCTVNPATVVTCDASGNTACLVATCAPKTGKCGPVASPDGKACDADSSVCTAADQCLGGKCVAGPAANCDDKNPCTDDSCDAVKGCVATNNPAACDADGSACTMADTCSNGSCVVGKAKLCSDSNPCTADGCDGKTGACVFDGAPLDGKGCDADGSVCTEGDACAGGKCAAGKAAGCDDGNPCTDDSCDAVAGCKHALNTKPCDADGNACTQGDGCTGGVCVKGKVLSCDDANPCTADTCDSKTGACVYDGAAVAGQACNADSSLCTANDLCAAGKCVAGKTLPCDDGNLCTDDGCNPKTGCTTAANAKACDADSSVCTANDVCKGGNCVAGAKVACDDGNPCTNDSCDAVSGCVQVANLAPCDDGSVCTVGDVCKDKVCAAGVLKNCDDGNPCTDDACSGKTGCVVVANAVACDDGNPCTDKDVCAAGKRASGSNICACQKDADCVDDGNLCNGTLYCEKGALPYLCKVDAKTIVVCDGSKDGACSKNLCDGKTGGCSLTAVNSGKSCSDGDACTSGDACGLGVGGTGACVAGAAVSCDDGNPCTLDSCDSKLGCAHAALGAGASCSDGNACTVGDGCNATAQCVAGSPQTCDDANACTVDSCKPVSGCAFVPDVGKAMSCWPGKPAQLGIGICKAGSAQCQPDGQLGACVGAVTANAVELCDGKDDTCDGQTDEGCKAVKAVLRQAGLLAVSPAGVGKTGLTLRQQPGLSGWAVGKNLSLNWSVLAWWKALLGVP